MKKLLFISGLLTVSFFAESQNNYTLDSPTAVEGRVAVLIGANPVPYSCIVFYDTTRTMLCTDTLQIKGLNPGFINTNNPNILTIDNNGYIGISTATFMQGAVSVAITSGSRNFNQAYQISSSIASHISVSPQLTCTLSLIAGSSGTVKLEISANGTTGWIYQGQISGSNTGALSIGINTSQITGGQLNANLPIGYYWRLTTTNLVGTPTYIFNGGNYTTY